MRKRIALSLAFLMLLISMRVRIDFHYCCGQLVQSKIIFVTGKATCGMEDAENGRTSHRSESLSKAPCCENHFKQIKTDDFRFSKNLSGPVLEYIPSMQQKELTANLHGFESVNFRNYKIPPDITSVSLPVIGVFII